MKTVQVAAEEELRRIVGLAFLGLAAVSFIAALAFGDDLGNAIRRFAFTAVLVTLLGIVVAPIAARRRRGRTLDPLPASAIVVSGRDVAMREWRTGVEMCVVLLIWLLPASSSAADFSGLMFAAFVINFGLQVLPAVKGEARERTVYRQLGRWGVGSPYAVEVRSVSAHPTPIASDA